MAETILEAERLVLRPPAVDDLTFILGRMNTKAVMRHLGGQTRPPEDVSQGLKADIEAFARGDWRLWTIWRRGDDYRIGRCGLLQIRTEAAPPQLYGQDQIGWTLAEEFWGQGYATEAARAVLAYAFGELQLPLVYSQTSDSNEPSTRMMHRLGFSLHPELGYVDPEYPPHDNPTTVWSLAPADFTCDG